MDGAFHTQLLPATAQPKDPAVEQAAKLLRQGELVAIPTETVYGLAANALNPDAVEKIFRAKGRPQDNPLIVHIASIGEMDALVTKIPDKARKLAEAFWPGPLTMVLPRSSRVPDVVTAGLNTVAIRMPSHPIARAVIRAAGVPIAAPSANLSGKPSPTTARHCMEDLSGKIPLVLDGGSCQVGVESTVVTLAGDIPRLLRPGAVTAEQLREVLGLLEVDSAVLDKVTEGPVASPGMKYMHYSPKASVVMITGPWSACKDFLVQKQDEGVWALVFDEDLRDCPLPAIGLGPQNDPAKQAQNLFSALRELDEKQARVVYARAPMEEGMGLAVYNRLIRAAGFSVIHLTA
ncbi:MAG: L-threonylcarbamoyladenylate synthase [Oscillospiraceae bacterium]